MPIPVQCETCGKQFKAADSHAGRVVKCPNCEARLSVPDDGFATVVTADLKEIEKDKRHRKSPGIDGGNHEGRLTSVSESRRRSSSLSSKQEVVIVGIRIGAWDALRIMLAFAGANLILFALGFLILATVGAIDFWAGTELVE